MQRILVLIATTVLVAATVSAVWSMVGTTPDRVVATAATVVAVVAQLGAIIGGFTGTPAQRVFRAIVLSVSAFLTILAAAMIVHR